MKIVHHSVDIPHATYLMSLVTGKYDVGDDGQFKGKPVRWNVPQGLAEMGKAAFGGTDRMIDVYSKLTGVDYPYAKFDQSAVPDYMFGGMENLSAVTQTIDALYPPEASGVANAEGLVLHELAHQWFGDYVTCSAWEHAWINEGWATFLPPFFVRAAHGKEAYDVARYDLLKQGFDSQGSTRPVVWTGYADPIDEFSGMIYAGGAARMFVLMHMLGEGRFWKATTAYLKQYAGKSVSTPAFFAAYSKSTGTDLTRFMKQWFYTPAMPMITVRRAGAELLIQQSKPYFTLDLPVWILKGNEWVKKSIHSDGPEVRLAVDELVGNPILVDPEVFLPAGIAYAYPIDATETMVLYRNAPNDAARMRMQEKMFGVLSADQVLELAKEAQNSALLQPLVRHVTDEAALIDFTRSNDGNVAHTAAEVLGTRPATDASVSRLTEMFDSHPNLVVRQYALEALLLLTKNEELAKKAWTMPSYNEDFRQAALHWYERNKPEEAREMALAFLANPDSEPVRKTAIALLGQLKDKPGERRAFNALVEVAKESSFGARTEAINALAAYGDPAAIPILLPTTKNGLHYLRRTAEKAIAALRG
jgi:aminopeptidase N